MNDHTDETLKKRIRNFFASYKENFSEDCNPDRLLAQTQIEVANRQVERMKLALFDVSDDTLVHTLDILEKKTWAEKETKEHVGTPPTHKESRRTKTPRKAKKKSPSKKKVSKK